MRALISVLLAAAACTGQLDNGSAVTADGGAAGPDAYRPHYDDLDRERARAQFRTTTDLMRYVIAPGCAAEVNECHSNEDFPDLSTEGNLWNLVGLPCNQGVGDRTTIEDFCEVLGDELRVTDGVAAGFAARIAAIDLLTDEQGEFARYEVHLDTPAPAGETGATFALARDGEVIAALGGGASLDLEAGTATVSITDPNALADLAVVRQGDENRNGVFGDGSGHVVRPGQMRDSYLFRRVTGGGTERLGMPHGDHADNPTELNRPLTPDEIYVLGSWISCMQPGDGVYSPIRYDCEANASNEGAW